MSVIFDNKKHQTIQIMKNIFANLFSYTTAYAYNSDSFAYINCNLEKEINGQLHLNKQIPETIVNFKTSKIKFNVDGIIYVIPFDVSWSAISSKDHQSYDSDFDCEDDLVSTEDDSSDDDSD